MKRESGSEVAEELMEGLVLLREQASTSARYWLCAACDRKFHTAADFAAHLEACHEQLVLLKQPALQQQQQVQGQAAGPADAGRVSAGMADVPPASQQPGQQQRQSPQQQQQQQMGLPGSGGLAYLTCSKCQVGMDGVATHVGCTATQFCWAVGAPLCGALDVWMHWMVLHALNPRGCTAMTSECVDTSPLSSYWA